MVARRSLECRQLPNCLEKFYDTFGEDVVNELVDWFNRMDATYRADLRDMNELNFARFDATLQQRFAQSDAKWERRWAELMAKWEQRFAEFTAEWERRFADFTSEWERRFAEFDIKWERRFAESDAKWEVSIAALDAKWEVRIAERDSKWERRFAALSEQMAVFEARMIKWMFVMWIGTIGTLIALAKF